MLIGYELVLGTYELAWVRVGRVYDLVWVRVDWKPKGRLNQSLSVLSLTRFILSECVCCAVN